MATCVMTVGAVNKNEQFIGTAAMGRPHSTPGSLISVESAISPAFTT
jgi:hypothetical protein